MSNKLIVLPDDEDVIPECLVADSDYKRVYEASSNSKYAVEKEERSRTHAVEKEERSRTLSESIHTDHSTLVDADSGTSADTILLGGRSSPSDIDETGQSESRRSSGYDPSLSESRRSSSYDPSQSESRRSSYHDPSQLESHPSSGNDINESKSERSSFYDFTQSETQRSSGFELNLSESRRSSIGAYSQEEFESLSWSQSQHSSSVLRFSRHFNDSDRHQSYTDDFETLDESDHSDAEQGQERRADKERKRKDRVNSRSRSLGTSDDESYDYNAESFESYNSVSSKLEAADKKVQVKPRFQSGALESRSAGSIIDSPSMYERYDEKPPLSARTVPSSDDQQRLDTDRALRAFVRSKLQTVKRNKASKRSTSSSAVHKRSLTSFDPVTHNIEARSKESDALKMFCRLKRDQLKNIKKNQDNSKSASVLPSTDSRRNSSQAVLVPEAFIKKVRMNQMLSKLHQIDFHEPSTCPHCIKEMEQNALLDFAAQKKAIALDNLVTYRLENIVAKDGLTEFGEYLMDLIELKKDRELVFDKLMRPLHQQHVTSDASEL